jgi:CBS-domain-containing membrane protein
MPLTEPQKVARLDASPLPPAMAAGRQGGAAPSRPSGGPPEPPAGLRRYLQKMRGTTRGSPPRVSNLEVLWSWLGAFLGIGAVALAGSRVLTGVDHGLMIGSLGASAVLVFGAPRSPLAQPRNLVGGHVLSALVGVACYQLLAGYEGLAAALAVSTAIAVMHLTRTLHPPGGATALIAVVGSEQIHRLGLLYALAPAGAGAAILLAVGLLVNNLLPSRRYPEVWW